MAKAMQTAKKKRKKTLFVHSEYIFTPPSRLVVVDGNLVKLNDCITYSNYQNTHSLFL